MTPQALVSLASAVKTAKNGLLYSNWSPMDPYWAPDAQWLREAPEEDRARLVGVFSAHWDQFVAGLFADLGCPATPEEIGRMDDEARRTASQAYEETYQRLRAERIKALAEGR